MPLWKWNNIRDWLYVYDHADALLTVLTEGMLDIAIILELQMK